MRAIDAHAGQQSTPSINMQAEDQYMKMFISAVMTGLLGAFMAVTSANAGSAMYEVTITNLTQAEKFTPILVASHKKSKA